MSPGKRIARSAPVRALACFAMASYIWFVHATTRWRIVRRDIPESYWREEKPFILAFWHGRLLMMPYCWPRGRRMHMLISQHRDGGLIANTISYFGMHTIRGSTARQGRAKGAQASVLEMLRKLKAGDYVGLTPDGPRGPRMRATDGIAAVARLAGVPVIPCGFSTRRRHLMPSWDRFIVPLPFSRGVFVWGEPILVEPGARGEAIELARVAIETGINLVSEEADRLSGHDPAEISPAPPQGAA